MDDGRREATPHLKQHDSLPASYFFDFYDEEFLSEVYLQLLKRPLDPTGASGYLRLIRHGKSRYVILDNVIRSAEAKAVGVRLSGMTAYRIMKVLLAIPIVGHILQATTLLLRAGRLMNDLRAMENHLYRLSKIEDLS
jgi:hypothetical protein